MEAFIGLLLVIIVIALILFYHKPLNAHADHINKWALSTLAELNISILKKNKETKKQIEEIGEIVTGEELMDMINKRTVSKEDIKNDLTKK